jgi:hypothetical protein
MVPFEVLTCPCCTGAVLHTLTQTVPDLLTPHSFLQLGKGALVAALGQQERSDSVNFRPETGISLEGENPGG